MSELICSFDSIHNLLVWIFSPWKYYSSIWNSLLKIIVPCFFLFVS